MTAAGRSSGVFHDLGRALQVGVRDALRAKRAVLVLYLANLVLGLLVALPLRSVLSQFAGRSLLGGETHFDIHFYLELFAAHGTALASFVGPALLVFGIYSLMSLFLSGGVLSVLVREERYRPDVFWGGSARFFGRFLRLLLWSLLLLLVLALGPLIAFGLQRLIYGSDPYQYVSFWGRWIQVGLALLGLAFFVICLDYARIRTVLNDENEMRRSLWQGVRFGLRNLIAVCGLALVLFLAGAVVLWVYRGLSGFLGVVVLLFLQQVYVFWRMALRVTRYGAEMELYRLRSENGKEALCPPNSGSQRPATDVLQEGQSPSGVSL